MDNKNTIITSVILTLAAVGEIALAFILYNSEGNSLLENIGWIILFVSAVFGWLPIITFRRRGQVKGRSYIHTSILVDKGIYSVVRHPQYLSGILIALSLPMIAQHWALIPFAAAAIAVYFKSAFDEEKENLEKFGNEYRAYMKRVPRFNFIVGTAKLLVRRK